MGTLSAPSITTSAHLIDRIDTSFQLSQMAKATRPARPMITPPTCNLPPEFPAVAAVLVAPAAVLVLDVAAEDVADPLDDAAALEEDDDALEDDDDALVEAADADDETEEAIEVEA